MISVPNGKPKRIEEQEAFPTILIAADAGSRHALARSLRLDGYLVFEASDEAEALFLVVSQSRPIHVLLADANIEGRKLARTLKLYRREMQEIFVTLNPKQSLSDGLNPEVAVARIRERLKVPGQIAADARANRPVTFLGNSPLHAVQRVASSSSAEKQEEFRPLSRAAAVGRPA